MDYNLMKIIKKEKEHYIEDENYNYLRFSYNVKVKVEDGSDVCLQNALSEGRQETFSCDGIKEEKQSCSLCSENFIDSCSLYKHNLTHLTVRLVRHKLFTHKASRNIYRTNDQCRNYITDSFKYKTPYNTKSAGTLHKCGTCNKLMKYNNWFEHIRNVHGCSQVQCDICKKLFKCRAYLRKHIIQIHNGNKPSWRISSLDEPIQCPKCPTKLKSKSTYKAHMQNCHSEEKFQCKICKSVLKCKAYLEVHMKRVHYDDGNKYNCDICGKVFKSPRYLRVHQKNVHLYS